MKKYVLCLVMLFMLFGCGKNDNDININIKDSGKYTVSGIDVTVDKFYYENGSSNVDLIIKNNNSYDIYIGEYKVNVYDKDGNLVGTFNPSFDDVLKAGDSVNQMFSMAADYSNGYRFEYVFDDVKENTSE